MDYYKILLPIALVLIVSKIFGIFCKKLGFPQVLGLLMAGLVIGLIKLVPGETILTDFTTEGLSFFGKIGVVLIMFTAGLETNRNDIKKNGMPSAVITLFGVVVPLVLGFTLSGLFVGFSTENITINLFYGVLLTSTSVCITIETLRELGKLNGKVGSSIIAASIIDDIIGIILLSLVLGMEGKGGSSENFGVIILRVVVFFIAAFIVGFGLRHLFTWLDKKYPHTRRIYIFGLAICFLFAYAAEAWFKVSEITGAFVAGLILSTNKEAKDIDRHVEVVSYMIFVPIFFANIGMNITFGNINPNTILFGSLLVVAAIISKLLGAGIGAKLCRYSFKDSLKVGVAMIARAEVLLVCAQKGVDAGIIDSSIMPFIVLIIIVTSVFTPIGLKLLYRKDKEDETISIPIDQ